jgi:DNA-binding CsgD family transcriptional regulator
MRIFQSPLGLATGLIEKLANLHQPSGGHGDAPAHNMTVRKCQIPDLIRSGLGDDAIAKRLALSRNTVRNHASGRYWKRDVHKRSEAIVQERNNSFRIAVPWMKVPWNAVLGDSDLRIRRREGYRPRQAISIERYTSKAVDAQMGSSESPACVGPDANVGKGAGPDVRRIPP